MKACTHAIRQGFQGVVWAATMLAGGAWAQTASAPAAPASPPTAGLPTGGGLQMPDTVANPYGLHALWAQGDWIAKSTLAILLVMSLASWTVLVTRLLAQWQIERQAKRMSEQFWKAQTVKEGNALLEPQSPFRYVADMGLAAANQHPGLLGHVDLNQWLAQGIERAVGVIASRLQAGLSVLATVGSTAPFVGLFGTVWGIYHALVRIGASGQASIDRVAGPVGEALVMTAIGLAVAVPAVLGYNWLVRRNRLIMDSVRAFGSDLHTVLMNKETRRG